MHKSECGVGFPGRKMSQWKGSGCRKIPCFVLQSFVRNGIPVCEATFREHQDDVIVLLKKVQTSTRQLQHAACHSKVRYVHFITQLKIDFPVFVFSSAVTWFMTLDCKRHCVDQSRSSFETMFGKLRVSRQSDVGSA